MTNPREIYGTKWSEKEYIITLHYYFQHKGEAQHADTPFVQELSRLLGRTPHSILYRLQNFASLDPSETDPRRKGKTHITNLGKHIFDKWSAKRDSLRDTAEVCLRDEKAKMVPDLFNPSPVKMPVTFRNYELLDEIGRGGFGIVFSCLNTRNDETYALKVIDGLRVYEQECVHRFSREIRALRALNHPHVIRIYEDNLETERGYPGFVMDLAECDLVKYLHARAMESAGEGSRPILSSQEAQKILIAIMDAVDALHQADAPILHRDVNPSNILRLFDGTWVLSDFSLAKFLPVLPVSTTFATATHHAGMGTAHYTAPEQYRSLRNANKRSDVFSLGWLIWELFSSEGPYPRREPSGLPTALEAVFQEATSHEPEDRFATVGDLKQAFLACG